MSKSIVILFDGTWNGLDDPNPTNIRILKDSIDPSKHEIIYLEGPGNDESNIIQHFLGGVFGVDCRSIRDDAINQLGHLYEKGDSVLVFGFSRGAAIARMLCAELSEINIDVDFLGCFDTVFAGTPFGPHQQNPLFGNLHVAPSVIIARHAVALDEDRVSFTPNLMNKRDGVVEVWFKGNHSDIGGGYKERGLSARTLKWMTQEAVIESELSVLGIPEQLKVNKPHREDMVGSREARRVGVMVNDEWTTLEPARCVWNRISGV